MNVMSEATGYFDENELSELSAEAEQYVGGSSWGCIIGTISITLTWKYCPTSACSDAC